MFPQRAAASQRGPRGRLPQAGAAGAAGDGESSSDSSREEERLLPRGVDTEPTSLELWDLHKLILFAKVGNQTATVTGLCCMLDQDLTAEPIQLAFKDTSCLETLVNLLGTAHEDCVLAALEVLSRIAANPRVQLRMWELNGVPVLVKLLQSRSVAARALAADTLANLAGIRRAASNVRACGGIPLLMDLLDENVMGDSGPARSAAAALHAVSRSARSRLAMRRAGLVRLVARALTTPHQQVLLLVMGVIEQCAAESYYQLDFRTEGLIPDIVRHLTNENKELQKVCASAIAKLAEDPQCRVQVLGTRGLETLAGLLADQAALANPSLLAAIAAAIWSCVLGELDARLLSNLHIVDTLVTLLQALSTPEHVLYTDHNPQLINVVGALAECCCLPESQSKVRSLGGLPVLVKLLSGIDSALLQQVARVLGRCARDNEAMTAVDQLDGVRLIWSLLRNPLPAVQVSAALALCPFIQGLKNSDQMVRSIMGGLDSVVELLGSPHTEVLAAACKVVAHIATNATNLTILTDYGVVPLLVRFINTEDSSLRRYVADAIGSCCYYRNNCHEFGRLGVIPPFVSYLQDSLDVQRAAAGALHQLSTDPFNCITMHHHGVVQHLLTTIASTDRQLQESSAGCLRNIRKLALSADKLRKMKHQ